MADRNKAIPAVYLFFEKDGKFLIARRCNTGYQDGNYNVPSGHVEAGETILEAAVREAKEEVGVDIRPEDLEFIHASYRVKHDYTDNRADYFFKLSRWSGDIVNAEPEKCDDLKWVSIDELPENMTPHVRMVFAAMLTGQTFSELDLEQLRGLGY